MSAFLIASFILAVTPGPGVLYMGTRSLTQGRGFGLASVAGVALGNLGNAVGASIGLAAVFAVSALAFTVVKSLGAVYLVYLGVQAIRAPRPDGQSPQFMNAEAPAIVQSLTLGSIFVAIAAVTDTAYALAAGALAPALARARGVRAAIGLGVYTVART